MLLCAFAIFQNSRRENYRDTPRWINNAELDFLRFIELSLTTPFERSSRLSIFNVAILRDNKTASRRNTFGLADFYHDDRDIKNNNLTLSASQSRISQWFVDRSPDSSKRSRPSLLFLRASKCKHLLLGRASASLLQRSTRHLQEIRVLGRRRVEL